MRFVKGEVFKKNGLLFVLLGVLNDKYVVQGVDENIRQIVSDTWFNDCKKCKTDIKVLRTPYFCAKFYSEKFLEYYKKHKKEIKRKEIDINEYLNPLFSEIVDKGLTFCMYDENDFKYSKYKQKIESEIVKVDEELRISKNIA